MPSLEFDNVKGSKLLAKLAELDPNDFYDVRIKTADKLSQETRFSLNAAMRGMEDESEPDYSFADLKEKWRK